ncbi:MAG: folylpolyglutamate synthase/dihydrofolate synthase family protein [Candidatus Aceula lacicola]|nr:folylpolyglutamate synthase/dihydrofolate synthase family protein [Candidatus Aceula lacicola]
MVSQKAKHYLDSLVNYEQKGLPCKSCTFKLSRIEKLLKILDHPERKFPTIHIAGTKGKGSTAAFASYILREAGFKVGLYTSPHLFDRKERIRILCPGMRRNKMSGDFEGSISGKSLNRIISEILKKTEKENLIVKKRLSFFEFFTGIAFYYFAKEKVDVAVVEVGLGGRLDATNVLSSDVCGITPIGLEHTAQLGNSILKITKEKAAIIKRKTKVVVVAPQGRRAVDVIRKRAKSLGVPILISKKRVGISVPLLGDHQIVNASLAASMVQCFLPKEFKDLGKYIARGIKKTRWPARFEIVKKNPFVVIDSAHTKESAQSLVRTVKDVFPNRDVVLILGVSKDKDIEGVCSKLKSIAKEIILTQSSHPRAFSFSEEFSKKLFGDKNITLEPNAKKALAKAFRKAGEKDIVLATGSIFLAAQIRKYASS